MELLILSDKADTIRYSLKRLSELLSNIVLYVANIKDANAARALNKDKAAINDNAKRLLDEYGNSILRLAYSYLHNLSDAEDILQETLIKYIAMSPSFKNSKHEKSWLMTVAANLSKNKIRSNKLHATDELSESDIALEREDLSFVWQAVRSLPESYREVIHLYYYEGYKTGEIAKILGKNDSSVRSDLKRGREKLREMLKEAYDFE